MKHHLDAAAFAYRASGELVKLVVVLKNEERPKLEWQDAEGRKCAPPDVIADEWGAFERWASAHLEG